jgi:succinyl-CoA synthetase beta subunit
VIAWIGDKNNQTVTIGEATWVLHTFLAEPLVPHDAEYYISFETDRLIDRVNFSMQWWVEIEEVWESVRSVELWVSCWVESKCGAVAQENLTVASDHNSIQLHSGQASSLWYIANLLADIPSDQLPQVTEFITNLVSFARSHWLTYLEVNPFVFRDGKIHCLDMVAKADTCEAWKQWENWKDMQFVKPFGNVTHPLEDEIDELDAKSYASVQFRIMNPKWRIGLLLGWGWASVVVMDKLAQMGLIDEAINYWDLSWNPWYGDNKAYIEWVLKLMLENNHAKQYLCYMWGIANFTRIDVLAKAYRDALTPYVTTMKQKNIHCIIRRGWPWDTAGLAKIWKFLTDHNIPHTIADGDQYLTKVLETITLK